MKRLGMLLIVGSIVACSVGQGSRTTSNRILEGAKAQLVSPASYTGAYYKIAYPGGDVPRDKGACTDVVIRALRAGGFDLQRLIHEDMKLARYPRVGKRLDTNIDHRRVPNQRFFFARRGAVLTTKLTDSAAWKAGDIVSWKLDSGLDHIGMLSDRRNSRGLPWVIHNIGPRVAEEDVLASWKITGHYRFPK